jgi:methylated-DNA-protein-cysteine methyltransferase-like protein
MKENLFELIYRLVRCIPPGQVATYGQVARLLGMPRGARTVGWALRAMPEGSDVPWQRVVNARGTISFTPGGYAASVQQALLEEEGIVFEQGRIDLQVYGWAGLDPAEQQALLAGEEAEADPTNEGR